MAKIYVVDLTEAEKESLVEITKKGQNNARKIKRANILLMADSNKSDQEIADILHTSTPTVVRTRHKFVNGGINFALGEESRSCRLPKIDDKVETILTTITQSAPPDGRRRWTLQLLAVSSSDTIRKYFL